MCCITKTSKAGTARRKRSGSSASANAIACCTFSNSASIHRHAAACASPPLARNARLYAQSESRRRAAEALIQLNRLCSEIAGKFNWAFANINMRPYYAEGSKTMGHEICEQLGWRAPDNVVIPMAGGSLICKVDKAIHEFQKTGLITDAHTRVYGAQATGCSPISAAVKAGRADIEPQKPNTIARSLAIGNPADGFYAAKNIVASGGWAEDVSDPEIVDAITLLAETEGIFTETAGGVTTGVARKLFAQGRIKPEETTVLCITGNGLKTTDALAGRFDVSEPIPPARQWSSIRCR